MTDPTEALLTSLRPSAPSAGLMARLRSAKPSQGIRVQGSAFRGGNAEPRFSWRRAAWLGGLGTAAVWVILSQWTAPRTDRVAAGRAADAAVVAKTSPPTASATTSPTTSQVFLPVESTRTLVSLQPTRMIQQPDQAPQRFLRAVWVDDVTAVGAETDAALHLRRAHEAYLPVSTPVY